MIIMHRTVIEMRNGPQLPHACPMHASEKWEALAGHNNQASTALGCRFTNNQTSRTNQVWFHSVSLIARVT